MSSNHPLVHRVQSAQVAVIHKTVDNSRWKMLRSLPALNYLGIESFTYPTSWRQLESGSQHDYLDYTYQHLNSLDEIYWDDPPSFGVITNSHYENETPYSIRWIVKQYTTTDGPLVVVTDNKQFTPEGAQRPLSQEQFATRLGSYQRLYAGFENQYSDAGFQLPIQNTSNLFFQDNAILHGLVTGEYPRTISELLEQLPEAPHLPLYDVFTEMFSRSDGFGSVPLDSDEEIDAVGRWLRRRVELERRTARDIAHDFNQAVADDVTTFARSYANQKPIVAEARRIGKDLDETTSSIHRRFSRWLTRYE